MLLNNSRYAVRTPIGLDTVLDNFKRPQIYRFYHDWYRPDLQALIIVGDVSADSLVKVIKAKFADLKNPALERLRPKYTVPLTGKNQFIAVTDKEMTATVAEVIIKHLQSPLRTAADYRKSIIQELFNQMLDERYTELSRKADIPFVQGGAGIGGFIGGMNSYTVSVVAKPGQLESGFSAVWQETERVKRFGFTATELKRAKTAYLNSMEVALQEKDKTPSESYVKEYQEYFLEDIASPGITTEYGLTKNALPGITLNDVNELAKAYITDTDRDILIMASEKDKNSLPDEATVNDWLKTIDDENLQPYQDDTSAKPLLAVQPVAGKIVAEQQDKQLHLITITLSNGVKVILKPTDFKNDEILFNGFAEGGTSLYSDADYQSAANAGSIIPANGVGNYNADQLDKFLEGKELKVSPYINERFEGIRGTSDNKDMETTLQMVYAYFTEPRKDTAIFNGIISNSKANLINRNNDPASVFSDAVGAVLGNYNIRRTGPTIEKINQVDLNKAYSIYKERFADASDFTFTFIGSVDTNAIKPLLEKYLGALPSTNIHQTAKDLNIHAPDGRIEKAVYKGTEPKATVILDFSGKFNYNLENKICLDALKECLEIRLLERLREDESGVYSPGVFANTGKFPQQRYSFIIQFGCAPQNVDKLIASTLDEINKLKTNGPLQENLDKWRAEDKSSWETQLKTNGFWLAYLTSTLQDKESIDLVDQYPALRNKITTVQVKETAGKYLSGENYIRLVLLPETAASK